MSGILTNNLPEAPYFLKVIPGIESVTFSWIRPKSVAIITNYTIQYSTDGSNWTIFPKRSSPSTTVDIKPLTAGVSYFFRVCATNMFGSGPYSSSTPPCVPLAKTPTAPSSISVSAGDRSLIVNWTKPISSGAAPITEYSVQYSSNSGVTWNPTIVSGNIISYQFNQLNNGTNYICRVLAKNNFGWSAPIVSNVVTPIGLPSPPLNFTGEFGDNSATVSWTPPLNNGGSPIVQYSIQIAAFNTRKEAEDFMSSSVKVIPISVRNLKFNTNNSNSIVVTNLTNGLFYALRIRAFNIPDIQGLAGVVSSFFSNKLIIRPKGLAKKPINLQATNINNSSISLSWTPPTDTGGIPLLDYIIQYYDGLNWITFNDGYNTNTSATIDNLTNGNAYTFRVAAINNLGVGEFSDNIIRIAGSAPQDPPTSLSVISKNKSVLLSWDIPTDNGGLPITHYTVQYSSNNGISWTTLNNTSITSTEILISGLTNNQSYIFRVAANNIIGIGPYSSNSSSVIPQPTAPQAPTNLKAVSLNSSALLSWTAPTDNGGNQITSYRIQKSSDSGSSWSIASTTPSAITSYAIGNLTNGTSYLFRVAAINNIDIGPYSDNSNSIIPAPKNILFDNDNIQNILQQNVDAGLLTSVSPWKEYIYEATSRLNKYIKYNNSVISQIQETGISNSTNSGVWQGTYPVYISIEYTEPNNIEPYPYIAYAGIDSFAQIMGLPGVKANSITYVLGINTYYANQYTYSNWVDILTHELCHALGVGLYWSYNFGELSGSIIPSNNLLSGSAYTQTQAAYNSITGLTRTKIPLESKGSSVTANAHWEDEYRPINKSEPFYYGVWDELMIGYAPNPGEKAILSRLTLKHLVDLGYEELSPGSSEGDPEVNTYRIYNTNNTTPRIKIGCNYNKLPVPKNKAKITT